MMWLRTAYIAVVLLIVTLILLPLQLLGLAFDWRLRRRIPRIWHRIACMFSASASMSTERWNGQNR